MTKTLYYINACPGARAVRLFSRYSKIHMNEKLINLKEGDHMKEDFLKLNPMHTVPTLELENGEGMYESRLILKYLDDSYSMMSKNSYEVDKWLFWDLGFLNTNVGKVIYPRLFLNSEPTEKDVCRLVEKLEHLDKHLENNKFLVKNELSIADLSSFTLVQNSQIRKDLVDISHYPYIVKWMKSVESKFSKKDWDDVMSEFFKWKETL